MPEERQCFFWSIWTDTEKALSDAAGGRFRKAQRCHELCAFLWYLNDYRYAMNYISFRMGNQEPSEDLQGLSGKGIDREIAPAALGRGCRD